LKRLMQQADLGAGLRMTAETTTPEQGNAPVNTNTNNANTSTAAEKANVAIPLPKCFCNWKNCRTYQKALREYKHPLFNGVIKLKFIKGDRKSSALKAAVDRTLHVDSGKRNEWKPAAAGEGESSSSPQCRYYVARHHFTEALMKQYLADRRAWDWNDPLSMKEAKTFLWSLDRQDVYHSEDEAEDDEEDDDTPTRYVQAPNVPKEQVREMLKKIKEEHKKALGAAAGKTKKSASSVHTQSTLSTSVTDTLKAFEDVIGHNEVNPKDNVLAQKEEENTRLRQELNECQEQLSMLHTMVKQLKVDMDHTRTSSPKKKPKKKGRQESSSEEEEDEEEEEEEEEDEDESSSEDEDEDDDDSQEWSEELGRTRASDDDETISTFHANMNKSSHSRPGSNHSVRKGSMHSRRSTVRRDSVHSVRRSSVHSRSRQSMRRDSIHSRRSMRGGMDDAASVVSRQSLQSVSPSIKSLPREIELMDEEEEDDTQGKDDYSFFDDSYRKPDDDARSVGSRSAASRASRRSMVSGARSRGRNSRRPGGPAPPAGGGNSSNSSNGKNRQSKSSAVPREIDLSGDELEDETYANVSTDTLFVTDKQIVDPYGEKGVYTGALSKSTGMPNGKGRLEYEKEGRWYEGDWIHGRWTGYGRLSNGDGDFYEGGLKNDHKHGTGIMRFADGRVFEGEYIRGQMIQGKMTYQDGSVYGGSWVDGMRHGRGKCIFVDGSEYEGEFREGNFHGHGKMTWNDGGWYVGEWCDGEMHGKGKEIRPDGSLRHDGEWSRGQPIRSANDSRRRRGQNGSTQGVEAN
jgi:hypothetical protein